MKAAGYGAYPRSHVTQAPLPGQPNCHDFFWTAGQIIDEALTNGDEALRPHFGPPSFICMGVSPENRDKAMKTIEMK